MAGCKREGVAVTWRDHGRTFMYTSAFLLVSAATRAAARGLLQDDAMQLAAAESVEGDITNEGTGGLFGSLFDTLTATPEDGARDENFLRAFMKSFLMILVTEIGDETFIIAAIMAMRHPRLVVYTGAMSALVFMTVISTALGYVLPNLISPTATHHAATVLYTIFGIRLLWIGYKADPHDTKEELEEVQQKITDTESNTKGKFAALAASMCTPVLYEALILTFLAEWGDRSQIATITLATSLNAYGVTLGAIIGHAICTGTAVLGGQLLALKISQRTVAFSGAALFLIFAVNNLLHS